MKKIIAAILIGFLIAGAGTDIHYTCTPIDGAKGCASFEKAVMHPADLLNNRQSSLVHFVETFVISSLIVFVILEILTHGKKRQLKGAKV